MQLYNTVFYRQTFSGIRSSSIFLVAEDNNNLFFTERRNSVYTEENKIESNDLYILLLVYVHCFCATVFSLILNVLSGFEKSVQDVCNENKRIYSSENAFFVENKDYLVILSFLQKEQIKFKLIYSTNFIKTVSL